MAPENPELASPVILRVRPCSKCGYNLYSLPREGTCPECGQAYKARKEDAKAKNPNRQLGQFRRYLRHRERDLKWAPAYWAVGIAGVTACILFDAGRGWWALAVFAVLFAAGHHANAWICYQDTKRKMEAIDSKANQIKPETDGIP